MEERSIPRDVRTSFQLREARTLLGLTGSQLAQMLGLEDSRTVRRWEAGDTAIPGYVTTILETAMDYLARIKAYDRELELFASGRMRTGQARLLPAGVLRIDDTEESIQRAKDGRHSFQCALSLLTKQPMSEIADDEVVHWYDLIPAHETSDVVSEVKSLPNEVDIERALAWFERHEGTGRLRFSLSHEPADYFLVKRRVCRVQVGASWRLRAGEEINRFPILKCETPPKAA